MFNMKIKSYGSSRRTVSIMNHLFELVVRLPADARESHLFQIALINTEAHPI
jgi:hypothetical protein